IVTVARAEISLEAGDIDARMTRQRRRRRHALGERREAARVLERIAGRHQPPYAIEPQPLEREQARGEMRPVRRIEGAAEQTDTHAGPVRGKPDHDDLPTLGGVMPRESGASSTPCRCGTIAAFNRQSP